MKAIFIIIIHLFARSFPNPVPPAFNDPFWMYPVRSRFTLFVPLPAGPRGIALIPDNVV